MRIGGIRQRVAAGRAAVAAPIEDRRPAGTAVALSDRRAARDGAGPAGSRHARS